MFFKNMYWFLKVKFWEEIQRELKMLKPLKYEDFSVLMWYNKRHKITN